MLSIAPHPSTACHPSQSSLPSQCGFFKRPSPYAHVPKYQAVRIRKEERQRGVSRPDKPALRRGPRARHWVTTWTDRYASC
ncbi:unnamed protein product [Lampetra planeri]